MLFVKEDTDVTIRFGPFLLETDGVTEVSTASGAVQISKNGATFVPGPSLGTHDANGWYPLTLTGASHTTDAGTLVIKKHSAADYLPVWMELTVLPANVYDSLFSSDKLQVDVTQISGAAVAVGTAQLGVNLVNISGAAVSTTTAQIGVNAVQISGDATTADRVELDYTTGYNKSASAIGTATDIGSTGRTFITGEINDALNTDTITLLGKTGPPASPTVTQAIGMLYKIAVHKSDVDTSSTDVYQLYNAAGTVVDQQAAVTDDGTTFTRAALVIGA